MSGLLEGAAPWPEEAARAYRAAGVWRGETLGDLLAAWAKRSGDAVAIVSGADRVSYRELDLRASRTAAGLLALGVRPGDRFVVQLPNTAEFVTLLFGMLRIGAVPVMALPAHRRTEILHLAELSQAVGYVTADAREGFDYRDLAAEAVAAVPSLRHVLVLGDPGPYTALADVSADPAALADAAPVAASDVAVLLISGGTTGRPKLIPRTHDDYAYNARASAEVCGLTEADRYLVALPVAHNFPLACPGVLGALGVGGTVVMTESPSPDAAFPLIERERVTVSALVPPLARLWADAAAYASHDLASLRLLQVGGAKCDADLARRLPGALGCALQQVFGMAEGLLNFTRADDDPETVATTQGRPLSPHDEVRVVDDDGDDVASGAIGELLTRGPYTLRGYYRADAYNTTAFTPDGFFRTGDLVRRTPTGHLVVEGRVKDVVNRGGEKVPATELEDLILAHPAVGLAAVIGLPDDDLGERLCAVVVPAAGAERPPKLKELKAHLTALGVARFKLPDRLVVLPELPLTAVGKISKRDLVARLTSEEGPRP
ncbi:(2,3-dihydroxybenzoyl)adenylate synthase [Actinocorallia sp. A-T 12471]|uniref:(2,3-dihydroxybenzoyl)adenylate synthase n=1 Tax=Actinocorallia sp. A-T 12471 TaxID=3089813 RepID=UPI0029D1609B|nr:AMP-binding protein [Actinocorallia sp. A-T 12471]MDX6744046.1 AMP-binding protein [Actinocorallia sp. A-T 12471]